MAGPPSLAQAPQFKETVEVERVLIDVRVVDGAGRAVPGLAMNDFRVEIDGRPATLESVHWLSATEPYPEGLEPETAAALGAQRPVPGRLVVFFFQKSLEPSRITGFMKMQTRAVELLDSLGRDDYVAVLSFDSHLKLWTDFTRDRRASRRAVEHSVLLEDATPLARAFYPPSLAEHLEPAAAAAASTPERGLELLGHALKPLPGPKTVVFVGWGLGELRGRLGFGMAHGYEAARRALIEARASLFALDVTNADSHTLEVGLEQAAHDTGGFYAKTHLFDEPALRRLRGALTGHYVLALEKPEGKRGSHRVSVRLVGRKGTVLAKASYLD